MRPKARREAPPAPTPLPTPVERDLAASVFPFARTAALLAFGALIAIVVTAVVLRFADLAHLPGGLYPDEAAEGLDAQRILHQPGFHPDWLVWFTGDGGREALFAYAVAVVFHFFGETALTLRGAAAGFGVAGVLGVWVLARRWGTWTALAGAAWAAGALWLVVISRDGMRNTIVPLFGSLALLVLLLWLDRPSRRTAALAGGTTALSMLYTYQPLKLLPIVIAMWLLWLWRSDPATFQRLRGGFKQFVAAFLVVAAPMIAVAITMPDNYFARAAYVSALNPGAAYESNLVHWLRTIAAFGFTGDPNARQDVAGLPLLSIPLTLVAVLGLARLWRGRRQPANALILCSLPVFMAPALFAVEGGSPHFLRLLGMAAPLGVTIGLGAAELVEQVHRRLGVWPARLAVGAVALGLAVTALSSWQAYSSSPVADRYDAYHFELVDFARAAGAHPNTAVIVDAFEVMDVWFLDYAQGPTFFPPGTRIPSPHAFSQIVALTRGDLVAAVGETAAQGARAVAWDLSGRPVVWVLTP